MRRRQEIFLDFTPLLDVTLILLFFFILFSSLEVMESREAMEQQQAQARASQEALEQQIENYEILNDRAENAAREAQENLELIEKQDPRRASNIRAMMEFNRSTNLKLILDMEARELRIFHGTELMEKTDPMGELEAVLNRVLENAGYRESDTVFCDFILDGSEPGSAAAYRNIHEQLFYLKGNYNYFYYSQTDLSAGKE